MSSTYPRGTRVGPYEILSLLPTGKGGMGAVYLARPRPNYAASSPPLVALKMAYGSHNDFLKYEVDHMARLSHPNILRVLPIPSVGTNHGRPIFIAKAEPDNPRSPFYIAVEYMRGGSIEQLLKVRGRLTPTEAVEIAGQIANALVTIHGQQIVHLDIKDSNILLREPLSRWGARVPQVIVSDFGIAWSIDRKQLATVYGSQFYTAPERAAGAAPHPQNDVFSLGVLLYEMLVGRTPFTSVVVPGTQITESSRPQALNPAVSPDLERVMLRALATDPSQRYQSVAQFMAELDQVPGLASPGRVRLPLLQGTREYLIAGLSGMAALLLVVILAIVSVNTLSAAGSAGDLTATTNTAPAISTTTSTLVQDAASPTVERTATAKAVPTVARPTSTTIPVTLTPYIKPSAISAPTRRIARPMDVPPTEVRIAWPTEVPPTEVPPTEVPPPPTVAPLPPTDVPTTKVPPPTYSRGGGGGGGGGDGDLNPKP